MKIGYHQIDSNTPGMGSMTVVFNVGANIETEGYRGICHLSEHLLCKPLTKVEEMMDRFGLNFNAATGDSRTYFYIEGLNENIKKFEKNLLEAINYKPTLEEFEKEKLIVLSEYNDTFTNKNCLYYNIWRNYFGTHSAIGLKKDIEDITYESFIEFLNTWYSVQTSIIRVGETDNQNLFANLPYKVYEERDYECFDRKVTPETFYASERYFAVDWICSELPIYKLEFFITYLNYGLVSPLMGKIREELGLVYHIGMYNTELGSKRFISLAYESDGKKLKTIRKEVKKLFSSNFINENRFEATKDIINSIKKKNDIFNFKNAMVMDLYEDAENDIEKISNFSYNDFENELKIFLKDFVKNSKHSTIQRKIKL